jgi:hypothetical protein
VLKEFSIWTELTTLSYNSQQIGAIEDYAQQFTKWFMRNMEILGPGGIFQFLFDD